jgi:hypothetical protein
MGYYDPELLKVADDWARDHNPEHAELATEAAGFLFSIFRLETIKNVQEAQELEDDDEEEDDEEAGEDDEVLVPEIGAIYSAAVKEEAQ